MRVCCLLGRLNLTENNRNFKTTFPEKDSSTIYTKRTLFIFNIFFLFFFSSFQISSSVSCLISQVKLITLQV
ncbi:hypothetical protein L1987_21047 [Smallanthus sonchifolius]|uniref:Uncharacterized protein n=1 Tax=Smallanthus sonchifolius TaxID=185202 RepID=A0ACB9IU26_9ASTR|nr:hypothetical protein L1987_21047 [Smallanthus sonchifolius]